jgi:hypothetical protein
VAAESLTPDLALRRLGELSSEVRAAVLLDRSGSLAACSDPLVGVLAGDGAGSEERDEAARERARTYAELTAELFERVDATAAEPPEQVQAQVPEGAVFAVRRPQWILAVVTGRPALPSLMFYDMRSVLSELEGKAA